MGPVAEHGIPRSQLHARRPSGDQYFEDVEPRFTEDHAGDAVNNNSVPSALLAGRPTGEIEPQPQPPSLLNIPGTNAGDGPGSPAISDISQASHFTSISERPINPNWQGAQAPLPPPAAPASNRGPRVQDVILDANPDFELPVAGRGRGRGGARYGRGRMTPVDQRYP